MRPSPFPLREKVRKLAKRKADFEEKNQSPLSVGWNFSKRPLLRGRRDSPPLPTLFTTFFPQEFLATHCAGICEKSKLTVTIRFDSWSEVVSSRVYMRACVSIDIRVRSFHGGLEMVLIAVYIEGGGGKKKKERKGTVNSLELEGTPSWIYRRDEALTIRGLAGCEGTTVQTSRRRKKKGKKVKRKKKTLSRKRHLTGSPCNYY